MWVVKVGRNLRDPAPSAAHISAPMAAHISAPMAAHISAPMAPRKKTLIPLKRYLKVLSGHPIK